MKTLVFKEVRENLKLAALGLVIYTLLLVVQYRDYVVSPANMSQPLADPTLLWNTVWFCGIFGAVLGWLQLYNERRPDLWAFLMHRPMTRTQIFLAKTLAGLGVYAVVVGAPLLVFFAWARWPGHVAAPFQWVMLRPLAAYILTGIVFYFAGMLTGLRQARWYGSRSLGLGMALIVCLGMQFRPVWWQGFLVVFIGAIILIAAAWGAFQTHGYYRGQPAAGKAALTFALMVGSVIVATTAAALLSNLFPQRERPSSWSYYAMTRDGVVAKVTGSPHQSQEVVDLEGKPITDPTTGRRVEAADVSRERVKSVPIELRLDKWVGPRLWTQMDISVVDRWRANSGTLWYYWHRYGRLVGYDIATRRCIGSLGPNGFATTLAGGGDRFSNVTARGGWEVLWTPTTLYRLDLEQRTVKPLFTTTSDDPILSASEIIPSDGHWEYTEVTTQRSLHLLTTAGQPVWKVPYNSADALYRNATLYLLNAPGQFALWMSPSHWTRGEAGRKPLVHVMWLARDKGVVRSATLPELAYYPSGLNPDEIWVCVAAPPAGLLALPWLSTDLLNSALPREVLLLCFGSAVLVCLPVGLWLGRRYRLPLAAQTGWAVFHVLFGVPGLLAFLSVQEWPARVPCPNCKRPRLVDRPQCEHCGADFAPPEKTGTEVFAPLQAAANTEAKA